MAITRAVLLAIGSILVAMDAIGQINFEAAKGKISAFSSKPFVATVDFSETGMALDGFREVYSKPDINGKFGTHLDVIWHAGVAAAKGKRTLFTLEDRWTPGFDAALSFAWIDELEGPCVASDSTNDCMAYKSGGFHGPFVAPNYEDVARDLAFQEPAGYWTLEDIREVTKGVAFGYRLALTEGDVISLRDSIVGITPPRSRSTKGKFVSWTLAVRMTMARLSSSPIAASDLLGSSSTYRDGTLG